MWLEKLISKMKFLNRRVFLLSIVGTIVLAALSSACSSLKPSQDNGAGVRFSDYQAQTIKQIQLTRNFQLTDRNLELLWNSPQEWRPTTLGADVKPQKGILLVHGLGDSPWSFHDVAEELAKQGFLVRTVLLPGHGTRPEDLVKVKAEEWQKVIREQAVALAEDVSGPVYLGGFSTGANLVLEYAYRHPKVAGLVLFSPGFKSFAFDWLAPLVSEIRPWIINPSNSTTLQTPVRYMNVPTNGYAQFYRTSSMARQLMANTYEKPVFMVVAEHDSVLDTKYLLETFHNRFIHPRSRLIWYGDLPQKFAEDKRILVRSDKLPDLHISQFSHMGLLFSPTNELYGINGSLKICLNSMDAKNNLACEHEKQQLWYSDWGYTEPGKIHARLTFNPYFEWQTQVLLETLTDENSASDISLFQDIHECYLSFLNCD